jgi:hypothetical protein
LSRHRRRVPDSRRPSRKTGVVISLTAAFTVAVIAGATYLIGLRPGPGANGGVVAAVAAIPASHTVAMLEKQREQLIAMSAASRTLSLVGQPKLASRQPSSAPAGPGGGGPGTAGPPAAAPSPGTAQAIAYHMLSQFGWNPQIYFSCLNNIWTRESGWLYTAQNASGAYGIPQALPGAKMASAGADWMTNPATQIKWGLGYIQSTYGNPCSAWAFWQGHSYY